MYFPLTNQLPYLIFTPLNFLHYFMLTIPPPQTQLCLHGCNQEAGVEIDLSHQIVWNEQYISIQYFSKAFLLNKY
jgi:hypothetical protein